MGFFTAIMTFFLIILLALFINRIATVALTFTGISREMARFQARSAFCTVGFTTSESENLVNHPVRRRIISMLMLLGNAGFVGLVATVLSSFSNRSEVSLSVRIGLLVAGLAGLWAIGMSKWVDDKLFRIISWALRRFTQMEVHDFLHLLNLSEGYSVTELNVEEADWIIGKRLDQLRLGDVGVNVLGVHRNDGDFVGAPVGSTYIRRGDRMIVYGAREAIVAFDEGKADPDQEERHQRQLLEIRAVRAQQEEGSERGAGYSLSEMLVNEEDWLVEKRLDELALGQLGIIVLGVERQADGGYIGSPGANTTIMAGDKLVVYGAREAVLALNEVKGDETAARKLRDRLTRINQDQRVGENH